MREEYPDLSVSISADIGQEYGEYERTLTTVVNTAVQPRTMLYMRNFESSMGEERFDGRLSIVRSDGGAMSTGGGGEPDPDSAVRTLGRCHRLGVSGA